MSSKTFVHLHFKNEFLRRVNSDEVNNFLIMQRSQVIKLFGYDKKKKRVLEFGFNFLLLHT